MGRPDLLVGRGWRGWCCTQIWAKDLYSLLHNLRHQHPRYSIVSKTTFTILTKSFASSAKLLDSKIVRKSLRVLHPRHREMGGAGCVQRGSLQKVDNETKISSQWQNPFKATDTCLKTPLTIMWKGNRGGISTGRAEKVLVSLLLPFLWSWWWWLSSFTCTRWRQHSWCSYNARGKWKKYLRLTSLWIFVEDWHLCEFLLHISSPN